MKIAILSLVLFASPAMAVTQAQVKEVQTICAKMEDTVSKLRRLATTAEIALGGDDFQLPFSARTYTLTSSQKTDINNYYNSLKAQLQAQLNDLP